MVWYEWIYKGRGLRVVGGEEVNKAPVNPKKSDTTWSTPQAFFDLLDAEFHFTLDVAALPDSAKCAKYFTPETDAMTQDWTQDTFWMNPPYGRGVNVYAWVEKAFMSWVGGGNGVLLLPASCDTKWFHDFCMKATEIRFVKDRLWFSLNGVAQRANHASIVVVFTGAFRWANGPGRISFMENGRKARSTT